MGGIEINLRSIPSFNSLYRQLTRSINKLPLDHKTITLLHLYKRHKYIHTKIRNNELYYQKMNYYYLNIMQQVIVRQDDLSTQELLQIAYLKAVPTKSRVPSWYMDFLNLNKDDINFIYDHGIWPVSHMLIDEAAKKKPDPKNKERAEFLQMANDYKLYLVKQSTVKNADASILDLLPGIKGNQDPFISGMISKSLKPLNSDDSVVEKIKLYSSLISKLEISMKQIRMSHYYGNITIQEVKIIRKPSLYGKPIPKCRARNLVVNKIKYFKSLMYSKIDPIKMADMMYLESIVDNGFKPIGTDQMDLRVQIRIKKRYKNFLKSNFCFDDDNDELVVFSKYRVLKVNYIDDIEGSEGLDDATTVVTM